MQSESNRPRPVVLCVLDGWGQREDTDDNAIAQANTPEWDRMSGTWPMGRLSTSSEAVGLPAGQMGNSEVGHMNLGAGRTVLQVLPRIDEASVSGFLQNQPLQRVISVMKASGGTMHVMGLLSPGGVHSHMSHFPPLVRALSEAGIPVALHLFVDGRDSPPRSALEYLEWFESQIAGIDGVRVASVCGRYFTMDRDQRWGRASRGYRAIAEGEGLATATAREAIQSAYARDESDEFIQPTVIGGYSGMQDGDGLLMVNFRADRARQILTSLVDPKFSGFARAREIQFAVAAGMADYSDALSERLVTLFPQEHLGNTMGELVSRAGMRQLRIAETEKYAHVTFFFNGGEETVFTGEDRVLVPSPKVATYDLKPEMSAPELTDRLTEAIATGNYDFILVNYANTDMVGHSGNLDAAIRAVECVDTCLGRLEAAVLEAGGVLFVTADHGNAEMMRDPKTGQPHTAHTTFPVPAMLVNAAGATAIADGRLADIAPTLLPLLGIPVPPEMDGTPLVQLRSDDAAPRQAGRASA